MDKQPISDSKRQITKRGIQLALGNLWLLDGLLQLQPRMFTADFANYVIAPASQGQPFFIGDLMHFFMTIFLWNPLLANLGIALIQIVLGVLILWKRTARIGLLLSIPWGIFVWYIGEGLSGLASGHAMLLMGMPGAAIVYSLLAVGVMTFTRKQSETSNGGTLDQKPAYWLMYVWVAIWVVGSIFQLMPGQNTIADVSSMISSNASAAPSWLSSIDVTVANYLDSSFGAANSQSDSMAGMPGMNISTSQQTVSASHSASGFGALLTLAMLQVVIAFAVIIPGPVRMMAVIIGSLLSLGFWVIGQSLGGYYTGMATDPNTGPLLILLGIGVLGCTQKDKAIRVYFSRIRKSFVREVQAFNEA